MLFQTPEFLVLMLVVLAGIGWLRTARRQHWLLLVASYVFYAWLDVRFLILLLISSTIDYAGALGIVGVRLSWAERARLCLFSIAASYFCLGLNWPAIQGPHGGFHLAEWLSDGSALREFFHPQWPFWRESLACCGGFALIWPLLFEAYFRLPESARRRAFLVTSMAANLGMLGFFKYYNFLADNLQALHVALPHMDLVLPAGISFYTFVTMSYGIDAYRGELEPERSFVRMALFVSYFPHLVAGPVIRPDQLLPTLHSPWRLEGRRLESGFHLALVGLFKKLLIADTIAPLVAVTLGDPQGQPSLVIWLGTVMFAVQIYCDFSGYTDIARGVSRMLGVELPLNFNFPYAAKSIAEFWHRWHISLSTWLRDYLYIPLGGSRVSPPRMYFNLLTTMVLGGLWHGAAWNFVIWGAYQGSLLCLHRLISPRIRRSAVVVAWLDSRPGQIVSWAMTMYFVLLGWLIFRVTNFADLTYAARKFLVFDGWLALSSLGLGAGSPVLAGLAFLLFVLLHAISYFDQRWADRLDRAPRWLLPLIYLALGFVFFFGWPTEDVQFIYFQF